jgi:hypothetical protein
MNRGIDRGRGLGIDEPFLCDSCSNLEIDEAFQISHKLGLDLAEKVSKSELETLDRFRGIYTPRPTAHPPKYARFVWFLESLGTFGGHLARGERSSPPYPLFLPSSSPQPPPSPPLLSPLCPYF